jgi:hypothetical protein
MTIAATAIWRRLDTLGHDGCWLIQNELGWLVEGATVFIHFGLPAALRYAVQCDPSWETIDGQVQGRIGDRTLAFAVARDGPQWVLNGTPVKGLEHLVDLDLSVTPATNLLQVRRKSGATGDRWNLPVAWLDIDRGTLEELPQVYERRSEKTLWYEAPTVGYEGLLEIAENGFIRRYPGLWESETGA